MAQQSSTSNPEILYPQLESSVASLNEDKRYREVLEIEKALVSYLNNQVQNGNPLEDVADASILPSELLSETRKIVKPKIDPLKRLSEIQTEEVEEEEGETEDEEDEDEEGLVEDEEDDAGGDYVVSHFDNGEGYDDNDDEGDEMTSII